MTETDEPDAPPDAAAQGEASTEAGVERSGARVVLQVLPRLEAGGVERGTLDIAIALKEAGWGSLVASAGGAMARELARHDIPHLTMPLASKNPFVMRANMRRLEAAIREHGVSIIHARSRAPAWSAEGAARRTGARFVTTFHGTYGAHGRLKRFYNRVMARGARVIAISQFIARHMEERYGVDAARIRTIPRGVDTGLLNPENVSHERIIQLAQRWQIPDDRRIILLPGRFARWKGHMLMIDALARLDRPDVRCLMVGADTASSAYKRALEARARARGVESQIQMADFCRDMPAAYMLSDVVVSASLDPEAFGRTLAEALAMGRPAVGPRHGGALEILDNGRIGWLYRPGDAGELAAALNSALELGPEERDRVAKKAMAAVRENFTKDKMCARTLEVYAEVLADAG